MTTAGSAATATTTMMMGKRRSLGLPLAFPMPPTGAGPLRPLPPPSASAVAAAAVPAGAASPAVGAVTAAAAPPIGSLISASARASSPSTAGSSASSTASAELLMSRAAWDDDESTAASGFGTPAEEEEYVPSGGSFSSGDSARESCGDVPRRTKTKRRLRKKGTATARAAGSGGGVLTTAPHLPGQLVPSAAPKMYTPRVLDSPPDLTCRAWAVADAASGKVLLSQAAKLKVQIASITKVMTAIIVLQAADVEPELLDELVLISHDCASMTGTSARLRAGEVITVRDLLYGMMLPSGNDAAAALAEYLGDSYDPAPVTTPAVSSVTLREGAGHPWCRFVAEMNRQAQKLGLKSTSFGNPHGLAHERLFSTAEDVCKLVHYAMRWSLFRTVIAARSHSVRLESVRASTSNRAYPCVITWKNTNVLLGQPAKPLISPRDAPSKFYYCGVKTGITNAAGGCLASLVRQAEEDLDARGKHLLLVVLGSQSSVYRFRDTERLAAWALNKLGMVSL